MDDHQSPKRQRSPKPKYTFRPEPWAERLIEKEIETNSQIKDKTAAIYALLKKTEALFAWKSRAEFLEAFMKKHGIPTPKTPDPSKPEPAPIQETPKEELPPEKPVPPPTDPMKRQWAKILARALSKFQELKLEKGKQLRQ